MIFSPAEVPYFTFSSYFELLQRIVQLLHDGGLHGADNALEHCQGSKLVVLSSISTQPFISVNLSVLMPPRGSAYRPIFMIFLIKSLKKGI